MTQEEILEYNKLCAEFLGEEMTTYFVETQMDLIGSSELHFHSDWNWIMEVVEAIEKKSWVNIKGCAVDISTIANLNAPTKKEAVVQAINQFLIWYEQNKTI